MHASEHRCMAHLLLKLAMQAFFVSEMRYLHGLHGVS